MTVSDSQILMANQIIANKLETGGSQAANANMAVDPAAMSTASFPDSSIDNSLTIFEIIHQISLTKTPSKKIAISFVLELDLASNEKSDLAAILNGICLS